MRICLLNYKNYVANVLHRHDYVFSITPNTKRHPIILKILIYEDKLVIIYLD